MKRLCAAIIGLCATACATPDWLTVESPVDRRPSPAICAAEPAEPPVPADAMVNAPAERWAAEAVLWGRRGWAIVAKERAARCGASKDPSPAG